MDLVRTEPSALLLTERKSVHTSSIIGQSVPRVEGYAKVTGAAQYTADVTSSGRLWGKVLHSPFAHARVVRIDTARARALPGVKAVLTADDLPPLMIGRHAKDQPLLCRDRVRFVGDQVAAVAAVDLAVAEAALDLIRVEYDELPPVYDAEAALQVGAPLVHDRVADYHGRPSNLPDLPNLQSYSCWQIGNVEQGFRESDVVFEQTFTTQRVHQLYLEPHVCTIAVKDDGRAEVWASNKMPYAVRRWVAEAAGLAEEQIIVYPVCIGGDFGGKGDHLNLHLCYFLAKATRRPVTMLLSYGEDLTAAANPRHSATISMRTGIKRDGRLWAREARLVFDGGAYAGFKPHPTGGLGGADKSGGPYRIPHSKIESFVAYTNSVPGGHYRGPGSVQALFAVESHMDTIAHELGIDPLEFRLMNAIRDGDQAPDGHDWHRVLFTQTLERARELRATLGPISQPGVGLGIAAGYHHIGNGESGAVVEVHANGSVRLLTCIADTGTGTHAIMQQIVAATLGRPLGEVAVQQAPTGLVPNDSGVGASRVTNVAGHAVLRAAERTCDAMKEWAASCLGCPPEQVEMRNGAFHAHGQGNVSLSWAEVAVRANDELDGPLRVEAQYATREALHEKSFVVQLAEVEVDQETGQVRVRRLAMVDEVGPIINPMNVQGQLEGALTQGLGFALMEDLALEEGRVTSGGLHEYKIPTIRDIPPLETILITEGRGPGPLETKAVSELTISSIAPAIANAVYDAVGIRITDLPITAEKLYSALAQQAERSGGD